MPAPRTTTEDRTFEPVSRFGSLSWVAATLGLSKDQLRKRLPQMTTDGFPQPDPIVDLYIKADVQAWIDRRRQCVKTVNVIESKPISGANLDAV